MPTIVLHIERSPVVVQKQAKKKRPPTTVQTLIFAKTKFSSSAAAKKWATSHGFKTSKVDTTDKSFRLRQREPGTFKEGSFRTITLAPGVKAVIGRLKKQKKAKADLTVSDTASGGKLQPKQSIGKKKKKMRKVPTLKQELG